MSEIGDNVLWPPPYYLLRDRIPFFLTVAYFYRDRFPRWMQDMAGWGLFIATFALVGATTILWKSGIDMEIFLGFSWHFASPMEWGALIIGSSFMLYRRGFDIFESYYLSLLAGMGGGWVYEILFGIPYWVESGFAHWNIFKANAVKVLFFEFQVVCVPLLLYIIWSTKRFRRPRLLVPLIILSLVFYLSGLPTMIWMSQMFNNRQLYSWFVRMPTILTLFTLLYGVEGDK